MRIALVGAVESTQLALETLIASGSPPVLVLTLAPEHLPRHSDAVNLAAITELHRIRTTYVADINSPATCNVLASAEPDVVFVIGWSQLCGPAFRAIARNACIGFHPSPLPRMRGRAVIPWTILMDEKTSGSTLFWMDDGIDTGDTLLQKTFNVACDETARTLYDKHMRTLKSMLPEAVKQLQMDKPPRSKQDHDKAIYCARRRAADGLIDWDRPAWEILRLIRAVGDPYPGAFTCDRGHKLHIDAARELPNSNQFIGLTGQVQSHTEDGFSVRCGDANCIEVTAWRAFDRKKPARHIIFGEEPS